MDAGVDRRPRRHAWLLVLALLPAASSRWQPPPLSNAAAKHGGDDGPHVTNNLLRTWVSRLCSVEGSPREAERCGPLSHSRTYGRTRSEVIVQTVAATAPESDESQLRQPSQSRRRRRVRRRSRESRLAPYESAFEDIAPPRPGKQDKKRVLMLISDTGGGHRASAQAMESMMEQLAPGACDVRIVDVFTDYCPWPFNRFVPGYAVMAKNAWMWKYSWHASNSIPPWRAFSTLMTEQICKDGFRKLFEETSPDLVVSLHPLTQHISVKVLDAMAGGRGKRTIPFATIVTDLGAAHVWWFHKACDACFIPSDAIRKTAKRLGLSDDQIRQYGLPVRPSFWQTPRPRDELVNELGLDANRKTVLIVGGGDGIGSLGEIVEETATELGREFPDGAQVVAVCGKNAELRASLEAKDFGNVQVQVCGFVKRMSDYMEVADVMITKAGPGTIAEATIRGLPTMLSSYLPGQEAGNVPFVVNSGFGEYSGKPKVIAKTVRSWIQDPEKLQRLQSAARAAATPQATQKIAVDLLALLEEPAQVPLASAAEEAETPASEKMPVPVRVPA